MKVKFKKIESLYGRQRRGYWKDVIWVKLQYDIDGKTILVATDGMDVIVRGEVFGSIEKELRKLGFEWDFVAKEWERGNGVSGLPFPFLEEIVNAVIDDVRRGKNYFWWKDTEEEFFSEHPDIRKKILEEQEVKV